MLEIERVSWKNFLSYGDYVSTLELAKLGQCLITGEVLDEDNKETYDGAPQGYIRKSNGSGKCLDGDTLITLATGQLVPIKNLGNYVGQDVVCLNTDYKNATGTIVAHQHSGSKQCYQIITASGKQVICSSDHRFLSFEGWRKLSSLSIGDYLAVNRTLAPITTTTYDVAKAELLGLMLGDGSFKKYTPWICISDDEPEILARVNKLIRNIDSDLCLRTSPTAKKGKSYRIVIQESLATSTTPYRSNPIAAWIDQLGLTGVTGENKFIPSIFFTCTQDVIVSLIAGLWAADGSVSIARRMRDRRVARVDISLVNKSERLMRQTQHLLLRLDIRSRLRTRMSLCTTTGKRFKSFTIEVASASQLRFLDLFGDHLRIYGCPVDDAIALRKLAESQPFHSYNIDLIPAKVWLTIVNLIKSTGRPWKHYAPLSIVRSRSIYADGKRATSRDVVAHFGSMLHNGWLRRLGGSDIQWDRIVAIEPIGLRETYDIEVTVSYGSHQYGEPNFIANDIITHNSNVVSAIQWILFGRTMHRPNPGDAVINWFTGRDCWGKIEFKNGDIITRTRNTDGHDELLFTKDGDEHKLTADTLSTAKNQQTQLARTFGLDWEIFCGSTFFTQYGRPWMEMADQTRKKALERLLHVDRFAYYTKTAKGKCDRLDAQVERANTKKAALEREISRLEIEINRLQTASNNFGNRQQEHHQAALDGIAAEMKKRDSIQLPNLEKLKEKWQIVKLILDKVKIQKVDVSRLRDQANDLNNQISEHEANAAAAAKKAALWQDKGGRICTVCEQMIPHEHVGSRVEPLLKTVEQEKAAAIALRQKQAELRSRQQEILTTIQKMETLITQKQPSLTLADAQALHARWQQHDREISRYQQLAHNILRETNPHQDLVTIAQTRMAECQQEIVDVSREIERCEFFNRHYQYIYRAYNDRTRVKSFVFRDHVPFLNSRLRHYLDVFGLDVKIELTDSLGVTSNLWSYEFESGGERKKTDVAFMLATFDFHEHMYGRQCNVLVLDEVDGRLDDDGIDSLVSVIKNDLANRAETILIISHRGMMYDTFSREIRVTRKNRMSRLEVIG
jgi:intein/homing endonuclease